MLTTKGLIPNANKIAILGLARAGKTTLLSIITHEFDNQTAFRPTVLIDRTKLEVFGKEITVWDYGGQDTFRTKYLDEPNNYFTGISIAYYVVDVQDHQVTEKNLQYFREIIKTFHSLNVQTSIVFLFHKNDPEKKQTIDQLGVQNQFLKAIDPLQKQFKFSFSIYNTTIFDPRSIITAIAQPILQRTDLYQLFTTMLKKFIDKYALCYAGILSKRNFELGNALSEQNPLSFYEWDKFLDIILKHDLSKEDVIHLIEGPEDSDFKMAVSIMQVPQGDKTTHLQLLIGCDRELNWEKKGLTKEVMQLKIQIKKVLVNVDLRSVEIDLPIRKIKKFL